MIQQAPFILIVEDDADTRANLRDILELDGYKVEMVGSAAEALSKSDLSAVSVIVLDRRLPDGTAEELLPRLQEMAPGVAVIVATGYADLESTITALRLGAADYLLKPINPDELRVSLRNIIERRKTEQALRDRETRLRAILGAASDGIVTIDERGMIEAVNPSAEIMFGYNSEEIVEKEFHLLLENDVPGSHGIDFTRETPADEDAQFGKQQEMVGQRKNGTTFPIDLTINIVPLDDRKIFTAFIRDVTDRKRSENELRQERDFAESLIETAHAIVLVLDTAGRIVRFNAYMEELTGYSLAEVQGKDWFELFLPRHDWDTVRKVFEKSIQGIATAGNVNPIFTRDGRERQIAWWDKTLRDPNGEIVGILAIGHDVTELRAAERQVLQSERLAAVGKAITGLAHESRNALQRSQACLEMLARRVDDRPEAIDLVNRVQRAQDDLYRLYEEVREYAAPLRLKPADCALDSIVHDTWDQLEVRRKGRDAELKDHRGNLNLHCDVDRFAISQVIRNILENALAACKNSVCIDVHYFEVDLNGRPAVRIEFHDNGPGLSPDDRVHIFDEFYTTKTHGTGLGMAIVKRFVEAHAGAVEARSNNDRGAEILITLPRKQP